MTDKISEEEFDPALRLDQARQTFALAKRTILMLANSDPHEVGGKEYVKQTTAALGDYQKALIQLQSLEAELEKRGTLARATHATVRDLNEAREEINRRIARFKERSSD